MLVGAVHMMISTFLDPVCEGELRVVRISFGFPAGIILFGSLPG